MQKHPSPAFNARCVPEQAPRGERQKQSKKLSRTNSNNIRAALRRSLIVAGAISFALPFSTHADSTDILLNVLIRKGILTEAEAAEVRAEVAAAEAVEREALAEDLTTRIAANLPERPAAAPPSGTVTLPSAVANLKLSGNFRLRYDYADRPGISPINRLRYRLQGNADYTFGGDSRWTAGTGVETSFGASSTNVSFGDFWNKTNDDLFVSRAVLTYTGDNFTAAFGKERSPFFVPGTFWDSDLRPEGAYQQFESQGLKVTTAQYFIETSGDDWLLMLQVEGELAGVCLAPIVMATNDDSRAAALASIKDFLVIGLPFEYKFKAFDMSQRLYGMWGVNLKGDDAANDPLSPYYLGAGDHSGRNQFFTATYRLGDAKKAGDWFAEVQYDYIEAAAYSPDLSNSDLLFGRLNMHGASLQFRYMITDFLQANLLLHRGWNLDSDVSSTLTGPSSLDLVQADLQVNF